MIFPCLWISANHSGDAIVRVEHSVSGHESGSNGVNNLGPPHMPMIRHFYTLVSSCSPVNGNLVRRKWPRPHSNKWMIIPCPHEVFSPLGRTRSETRKMGLGRHLGLCIPMVRVSVPGRATANRDVDAPLVYITSVRRVRHEDRIIQNHGF
jgi:hypothetical protein